MLKEVVYNDREEARARLKEMDAEVEIIKTLFRTKIIGDTWRKATAKIAKSRLGKAGNQKAAGGGAEAAMG